MDIARLAAILRVPAPFVEAPSEADWARVEAELGTPLPADYREFVGYFGSVRIGTVFVTYSPFDTLKTMNVLIRYGIEIHMIPWEGAHHDVAGR